MAVRWIGIVCAVSLLISLVGCMSTTKVKIERLAPPVADVHGIRELAVLPFADQANGSRRGELVAEHLSAVVANTGRYRVLRRDQMNARLAGAGINFSYPPDAALVRKIGAALGVDAILCGSIEKFQFAETNRLVKVKERVWTGKYARDGHGDIISDVGADGEATPRKRYEKRLVEKNQLTRYAALNIHFRVADAFLGNVICAKSESESGSWEGRGSEEIAQIPSRGVIFNLLLDRAAKDFVRQIAAHPVEEERVLEWGVFYPTRLGVELAKNDLWDEAIEKWMQAIKAKPDDSAAYYNLGVALERKGLFDLAYKSYQNALSRNPQSKRYIKAIANIQKLMKELE
jgi:TolB-like protein